MPTIKTYSKGTPLIMRLSDGMRRPVSSGKRYAPDERRAQSAKETGNEESSTAAVRGIQIFKNQLTIGLELEDRTRPLLYFE
jgi:hypothetical protein